ncbi:hypothetical protein [Pseudonocardia xishanensis]|uniref:Pilus assembly protein n=1 Tax=Pseudonocardia xishanensis TaxID=630995 RepID=A0ABP8RV67_9PSEU
MEAAILAGTLGLVIAFGIAGVRVAMAESATSQAAASAARIASIQRDPDAATTLAEEEAREALSRRGIRCASMTVVVTVDEDGGLAVVRAEVSCDALWSDLAIPGVPGAHRTTASAVSPIDTLRERG